MFSLISSIAIFVGVFTGILPIIYATVAGFVGLSLYSSLTYFTQIYLPEEKDKKYSFRWGVFASFIRTFSYLAVFAAVVSMMAFLQPVHGIDFEDTYELVNIWLLIIYLSIPMLSSIVFNLKN